MGLRRSNPPVRINPVINGKRIPIVAIGGKSGYIFVLNANNGGTVPNFKIPEVAVPDLNSGVGAALATNGRLNRNRTEVRATSSRTAPQRPPAAAVLPGYPTAANGTPIVLTCQYAAPINTLVPRLAPGAGGSINWPREAYNPATNDLYVCASSNCSRTRRQG